MMSIKHKLFLQNPKSSKWYNQYFLFKNTFFYQRAKGNIRQSEFKYKEEKYFSVCVFIFILIVSTPAIQMIYIYINKLQSICPLLYFSLSCWSYSCWCQGDFYMLRKQDVCFVFWLWLWCTFQCKVFLFLGSI